MPLPDVCSPGVAFTYLFRICLFLYNTEGALACIKTTEALLWDSLNYSTDTPNYEYTKINTIY